MLEKSSNFERGPKPKLFFERLLFLVRRGRLKNVLRAFRISHCRWGQAPLASLILHVYVFETCEGKGAKIIPELDDEKANAGPERSWYPRIIKNKIG